MDKYKEEIEKENQNYLRKINEKNELLNSLENFTRMSYSIFMNSNAMLYRLKVNLKKDTSKNSNIKEETLNELIKDHYILKEELHVLKKDSTILSSTLGDVNYAIIISKTYNELYFLNDFIELQILQYTKKTKVNTHKILGDVDKAINTLDELRRSLDQLHLYLFKELNKFYPSMNIKRDTFVMGTDLFKWYYPNHPFKFRS